MPLLRKKEFQKSSSLELYRDDEEVFYCEVTQEIFRDYEEFCQRIILVNSMVWSCAMTGKANLTYGEALNSEEAAQKSLNDFPVELKKPVLYLASKTKRSAFGDMAEDVYSYVKDRYFVGEVVESSFTENSWRESHVLQVIAPTEEQIQAYIKKNSKSSERFHPPASLFRYEVEQMDEKDQDSTQVMMIEASHVRRKKGPFSRDKNRLFLKQFVELNDQGIVVIKDDTRQKYRLDNMKFDQIFDGPLPNFEHSKKQEKKTVKGKVVRQDKLTNYLDKSNGVSNAERGKKLLEEMRRKEEEYKQMKLKQAEEKQKRKEENIKISSYVKDWYKPRDDQELEDQKKLPTPTLVQMRIPQKYFGDALMVVEFCHSFSTLLSTKDFFPGGLTLDLLERALTEKEVAGPFTDIVQMLLTAIFNVQNEEDAEKNSQTQAEWGSDEGVGLSEATHLATTAAVWCVCVQGVQVSRLPLCPHTVTEVLRLHVLAAGARLSDPAAKWRYQQRGGYMSEDDPGLTLRLHHPHILKALAVHNVNQLPIGDKIKILTCLVDQLLTYADVRDAIEERLDKSRQLKADLRSLQATEKRREQELVSAMLKNKRENKGRPDVFKAEEKRLQEEAIKKRAQYEEQSRELLKAYSEMQVVLGTDRAYQRYIKVESIPGFFVENDDRYSGLCLDKVIVQKPELVDANDSDTLVYVRKLYEKCNGSDKENENGEKKFPKKINGVRNSIKVENDIDLTRELLMCTAGNFPCPVHSYINKPQWSFYNKKDDIQALISSLNKRGVRESELRQILESDKQHMEELLEATNPILGSSIVKRESEEKPLSKKIQKMYERYEDSNLGFPAGTEMADILQMSLIDNILEMEEKINIGGLGRIKVKDRDAWRKHISNQKYEELEKTLIKKEENHKVDKLKAEGRNSRPGTPDSVYKDPGRYLGTSESENSEVDSEEMSLTPTSGQQIAVKALAIALAQIAQAVDSKFLKKPLGHADVNQKKKEKEEHDVLERWEQSLLASTSYSQLFLHFCTLDNCVMWSRSALLTMCQICHRKRDPQSMLLCDGCNKGHHMYCLKPKLTAVPEGDWFCVKCKPTTPQQRVSKRTRKNFSEQSEDEEEQNGDSEKENGDMEENGVENSIMEVCEVCGSGGHVICCDFCPKVYHLDCTQPPLRRIPRGEWKCQKCRLKNDKHSPSDSGSGEDTPTQRRSQRRTHEIKGTDMDADLPLHNATLQEFLADVLKHKDAWPFTKPVTKHEVPDYFDIIKTPMDFGTIKYKLNMGEYKCDADLMEDAVLVFQNCDTYNNSQDDVYKCGVRLLKYVEKRCQELGLKFPENVMGVDEDEDEDGPPKPKRARHH